MKNLALLALLLIAPVCFAQIPKPQKNTYVNDFAHVLTKAEVNALNVSIHKIERTTSVQMAIVLVNKLPKDYEIEDFALLIGRKWHVGKNKNGLVYVAAIKQHKQRLEVAQKLANIFTDSLSSEILARIKPGFRQQNYNVGLQSLVNDVATAVQPLSVVHRQPVAGSPQAGNAKKPVKNTGSPYTGFIVLGAIILVLYLIFRKGRGNSTPSVTTNRYSSGNRPYGYGDTGSYGSGYNYPPDYNAPRSNTGAIVGGLVAGAAAGYAARAIQDEFNDNHQHHHGSSDRYSDDIVDDNDDNDRYDDNDSSDDVSSNDNDSSDWGNWDSGSSSDSSDSGSSSSDDDGYSGSGSSSDW